MRRRCRPPSRDYNATGLLRHLKRLESVMHALFRDYMLAHMAGVLGKFRATNAITHRGEKGTIREALAAGIVRPWLGPSVKIGTGFVIQQHGGQSLQCDNVLYWPDVQPPTALGGEEGPCLFPVEGVASVVEVKSKLTTSELQGALANVRSSCRALRLASGASMELTGYQMPHPTIPPFSCILAFESEVASNTLIDTLKLNRDAWDLVCVLGMKGGLYAGLRSGDPTDCGISDDLERLLAFSVILRDNIQHARASRGTPTLQNYVTAPTPRAL